MSAPERASTERQYDEFWNECIDYNVYHPGARHRRRRILQVLRNVRFSSVLDIGCGSGNLLRLLKHEFPSVKQFVGADVSPEVVEFAGKKYPDMRFLALNIENGHLDEKFDLITCSEVIEHLHDQQKAFQSLAAMLSKGGYLLLTCPTGKVYPTERHFGHTAHPSLMQVNAYAASNGLEVVVLENWGWPVYRALKEATNVNSEWALKNFASGRYGWKQKLVSHVLYAANFLNARTSEYGCQLFALLRKP